MKKALGERLVHSLLSFQPLGSISVVLHLGPYNPTIIKQESETRIPKGSPGQTSRCVASSFAVQVLTPKNLRAWQVLPSR